MLHIHDVLLFEQHDISNFDQQVEDFHLLTEFLQLDQLVTD
jgi:hypothetical protein